MSSPRSSTIAVALVLALLFHAATAVLAQQAGTADDQVVLRGRVVAGDASGRPLPGARVTAAGRAHSSPPAVSDREGWFETRVPARGGWSLRVTKAGFAPAELANAPGGEVAIVRMTPGAAVTGRVVDQRGDPVPGAVVRLRPADCPAPCPEADLPLIAAASGLVAETDDLGEYRIGSLPSGRYDVSISPGSAGMVGIDLAARETLSAMAATLRRLRLEGVSQVGIVSPPTRADRAPSVAPVVVALRPGEETTTYHVLDAPPNRVAPPAGSAGARSGGTIAGRITGPTGQPVGGAVIQVTGTDGRGTQRTVSNTDGRYALAGLAAGSYRLQVRSDGLPPVQYGQQHSQQQGTPIAIRGTETVSGIDVLVPRGGVISGRVVDIYGEPIEGMSVQVWERRFTGGRTMLAVVGGVRPDRTDDRGQYRIYGLLPGTYDIVASEPSIVSSSMVTAAATTPEAAALAQRLETALRGSGSVEVSVLAGDRVSVTVQAGSGLQGVTQPRVFYPASPTPEHALPVRIEPGFDGHGADIVFAPPPAARVTGVALDSSGEPARGSVTLTVSQRSGVPVPPARSARVAADGTFEFPDVPPGDYALQIMTTLPAPIEAVRLQRQEGARTAATVSRPPAPDPEFGMQFVTVSDAADVSVSIRTAPLSRLTARVVADGDRSSVSHAGFTFSVVPADLDRSPSSMQRSQAALRNDWTSDLAGLAGPFRLELLRAPAGWYLKSAHVAGIDAAEFPVTLPAAGSVGNAIDVVVARGGEISGRVVNERGEQTPDYAVVVFPIDPTRWDDRSRYLKMTRAGHDGTFGVTGLPPGEYWVAAVDRVLGDDASGEWQRPHVLSALTPGARRVRVAEGQQVATELRLVRMSW